eukprot:Blabericola_migrator_1__7224@NODE_366_length_9388_cov_56_375818_g293_i0_p5_GENE_NODE_366_length_9388_cov_56_375818_g293_i0NODE_366_length_9388_cov_56_375818_g293_i0_p5_ORF_typecomplete_len185_score7_22Vac7/PF12751_7/0_18_NODE_366_length_9388_cov_56_375818_g293_i084859039
MKCANRRMCDLSASRARNGSRPLEKNLNLGGVGGSMGKFGFLPLLLLLASASSLRANLLEDDSVSTIVKAQGTEQCYVHDKRCGRCVKQSPCAYCAASSKTLIKGRALAELNVSETCVELAKDQPCGSGWVYHAHHCPNEVRWWAVFVCCIVFLALVPLLGICLFFFMMKKCCCALHNVDSEEY